MEWRLWGMGGIIGSCEEIRGGLIFFYDASQKLLWTRMRLPGEFLYQIA